MSQNRKLILILTFFISFVCLVFFYSSVDSFGNFFNQLKTANYTLIVLAILLLFLSVVFRALRWNIILFHKVEVYRLYKIQLIGYFLNNTFPFKLGEIFKSFILSHESENSNSDALSTVLVEKFLDMFSLLIFAIVCLLISPVNNIGETSLIFLVSLIALIILVLFLILFSIKKIFYNLKYVAIFFDSLELIRLRLSIKQIILSNFYGFIIWIIYWINVYLVFKAFNYNIEPYESLLILVVASVINSIPSLPGAMGTFHLGVRTVIEGLNIININTESLITILHLYGYIALSVVGLFYFILNDSIGFNSIRKQIKL